MSRRTRILFLDDVATDAEISVRELRRAGFDFEARVVESRTQFESALREFVPDLILSDFSLPQLDGPTAMAIARSACPDVPVIFVSGTIGEEQAIETLKSGATDYVLKDRLVRLAPAVERALRDSRERAERRSAEERLRKSEDLHRTVVSALGEGVLVVGADLIIAACNPSAERILGAAAVDLVGKPVGRPFSGCVAEDGEPLADADHPCATTLRTGEPQANRILGVGRADGSITWLSVNCRPLYHPGDPSPYAAVKSFADITERRQLEEQFRQSQRLESIGLLAGGVAHDFNNLMTAVSGYTELVLAALEPDSPLRPHVEEIRRAGARASSLTQQLLAFSRKQVLERKVLDLNTVIGEVEPMLRRLLREDIKLSFHPGDIGRVRTDLGQLEQVIMNLAVNAGDAMPRGGRLIFETADVELDAEYARRHAEVAPGTYVMLSVSDTGEGMDAATLAHIFEPFFTTKAVGKGTGLGLSTVYGIVKQSGGHIWVYSEPKRGTTFKIYLPRVDTAAPAAAAAPRPGARGGSETILLVEDEAVLRPLIRLVLHRLGYSVLEAEAGGAALDICRKHAGPIHLMVSDVIMPGMGGKELAGLALKVRPDLKVLFLSGYTDQVLAGEELLRPGQAFMQKPFTNDALARRVREVLDS